MTQKGLPLRSFTQSAPSTDEERTFELNGYRFTCKPSVKPETFWPLDEAEGERESLIALDKVVIDCLAYARNGNEERLDAGEAWHYIRSQDEPAITLDTIRQVMLFCVEATHTRPPTPPSSSTPSPATSGTTSTAGSSSQGSPPAPRPLTPASSPTPHTPL